MITKLYQSLRQLTKWDTNYIKNKWEEELNTEISQEGWHSMLKAQHTSRSSKNWRIFGWKCLVNFFITPKIRSKF